MFGIEKMTEPVNKRFSDKKEKKNLAKSCGLCPVCGNDLLDNNDTYIARNKSIIFNGIKRQVTLCQSCFKKNENEIIDALNKNSIVFERMWK